MDILTLDDWNNFHRENYQSHKDYNSRIDAIFRKISIGVILWLNYPWKVY